MLPRSPLIIVILSAAIVVAALYVTYRLVVRSHHVTSQSPPGRQDPGTTTLRGNTLAFWRAKVLRWRSATLLAP